MNYHQTPEDIIKAASPAQRIIWNALFLQFGERIALTQCEFIGSLVGSEFNTYSANKYYFAMELALCASAAATATSGLAILYNSANVGMITLQNNCVLWNNTAAAANYYTNDIFVNNIHFSRISPIIYSTIKFTGYRLTF